MKIRNLFILGFASMSSVFCASGTTGDGRDDGGTTTPPVTSNGIAQVWITKADGSTKLTKQADINFTNPLNAYNTIEVDPSQVYQTVDGFGYTLTGGSVDVINQLSPDKKDALLQELFGNSDSSIGVSYIRLSIGASDLNSSVFSYDDMPAGQTDVNLANFSLAKDQPLIDMLKKILAINPSIKIMAAPWSPPVWMKDNGNSVGGSLLPQYYATYAQYFVKYIQGMKAQGITIDAITPQNEPLHPGNNPSLLMLAEQQRDFIKNNLGPAFQAAGIKTKIVVYDHNLDNIAYATTILSDPDAAKYVDGSAFHAYNGDISAMGTLYQQFPTKNVYFTEQWTGSTSTFSTDLLWHSKNIIIGSMRNYAKTALEWNLANDPNFNPHTDGGCTQCKGAVTVNSNNTFDRNVAYYIIAHASKFVPQNSVRIGSTQPAPLSSVAFAVGTKTVLIVLNESANITYFNIKSKGNWAYTSLAPNTVATYVF